MLAKQRIAAAKAVRQLAHKFTKAADDDLKDILDAIENGALGWDVATRTKVRKIIEAMARDRARAAMEHVGDYVADAEYEKLLQQANERAVAWAQQRVGNLITDVSQTTRDVVNELTAAAINAGLTNHELADQISQAFGFSSERALMIAGTETAFAEVAGTLEGYAASGVVDGKQWSADANACPLCLDLNGVIVPLDEEFPEDAGDGPPLHPNCRCLVSAVLADDVLADDGEA